MGDEQVSWALLPSGERLRLDRMDGRCQAAPSILPTTEGEAPLLSIACKSNMLIKVKAK